MISIIAVTFISLLFLYHFITKAEADEIARYFRSPPAIPFVGCYFIFPNNAKGRYIFLNTFFS